MSLDPQVKEILEETAALGLPAYHDLSPTKAGKQMLDLAPLIFKMRHLSFPRF
jgi:hypothetical protein